MPRAKQQGTVEVQEADIAAEVQVNGTKAERGAGSPGGKAEVAKRAGAKSTKAVKDPKDDVTAKAQQAKHPKAAPAQKAPDTASRAPEPAGRAHEAAGRAKRPVAEAEEPKDLFFEHQRALLAAERNNYTRQAEELRAQAEALALEHEPGDVQFDEEGGEGGTANVDRELDLHLSAQAQAAIEEIDAALAKIAAGTYGLCESCGNPVPKARLEALPHARLCVSCKSGGLTTRRQ